MSCTQHLHAYITRASSRSCIAYCAQRLSTMRFIGKKRRLPTYGGRRRARGNASSQARVDGHGHGQFTVLVKSDLRQVGCIAISLLVLPLLSAFPRMNYISAGGRPLVDLDLDASTAYPHRCAADKTVIISTYAPHASISPYTTDADLGRDGFFQERHGPIVRAKHG